MPRKPQPWFRFYVEACADRKLRRLTPEHRWLFVACLAAARASTVPGWLLVHDGDDGQMDEHDLADWAGMKVPAVRSGLIALCDLHLLLLDPETQAYAVPNWSARQFESDDVTIRTAKHRSKERSNVVPGNTPEQSRAEQTPVEVPVDGTATRHTTEQKQTNAQGLELVKTEVPQLRKAGA